MDNGYIKLFRKMKNTSFYKKPIVAHLACHLLIEANHKPKKIIFNNQEIEIKEGELITGRKALSEDTGLTEQETRTSLQILKNVGFLTSKSTNKFTMICINKYSDYQNGYSKSTNTLTNQQPTSNQQITTNNKESNDKNNKKTPLSVPLFEELWEKYPNKDGKREALRHFTVSVKTEQDEKDIKNALNCYLQSDRVKNGFIKNGSTWFNNWRDWIPRPVYVDPKIVAFLKDKEREDRRNKGYSDVD